MVGKQPHVRPLACGTELKLANVASVSQTAMYHVGAPQMVARVSPISVSVMSFRGCARSRAASLANGNASAVVIPH